MFCALIETQVRHELKSTKYFCNPIPKTATRMLNETCREYNLIFRIKSQK